MWNDDVVPESGDSTPIDFRPIFRVSASTATTALEKNGKNVRERNSTHFKDIPSILPQYWDRGSQPSSVSEGEKWVWILVEILISFHNN